MAGIEYKKNYVLRVTLKSGLTDEDKNNKEKRQKFIDFCLNKKEQRLAIGWGCDLKSLKDYDEYYNILAKRHNPIPSAINRFKEAEKDDLCWTRDLEGNYWICRVKSKAKPYSDKELVVGAILPVEAYKYGMEVPGQIKHSFTCPRSGTSEKIKDDPSIIEYSKYIFNKCAKKEYYTVNKTQNGNFLQNLEAFELEELVISYLQIAKDLYVLSNSIANKSTTIKIECEFMPRKDNGTRKAVVQVKGPKAEALKASSYKQFVKDGYDVYLYCPDLKEDFKSKHIIRITEEELLKFVNKNEKLLPANIMI